MHSLLFGNIAAAELLLQGGSDVTLASQSNSIPLHFACFTGKRKIKRNENEINNDK